MRLVLLANPDNIHVRRWVAFLLERGHQLRLIADPHTRERPPGVETVLPRWNALTNFLAFRLTPAPHGNSLWKPIHYRPLIRAFHPDVVHGFEAYYNGLATAWAGPYPKVLTPWGMDIHRDGRARGLSGWIVRRALRGADLITTNDETLADFLQAAYGLDRRRVRGFSWGVDLTVFRPGLEEARARWRAELAAPAESPIVLYPRNFDPHWGAELFMEALGPVLARRPEAIAVILAPAPTPFRQRMKSLARERGQEPAVRWIERVLNPPEMAGLYNAAEVFVSAPRSDLLAMTVLEALACGCFPVLADLPAYRKHAWPGADHAIVLDRPDPAALAEAIVSAFEDGPRRRRAAAYNAERMVRQEDARINMARMEEVYAAARERAALRSRRTA